MRQGIQQKLQENFNLLKAALQKPKEVSTVFPTSKALSFEVLSHHDFKNAQMVVELGPGTGAITRPLLQHMHDGTQYLGVELVEDLVQILRREFSGKNFVCSPAQDLGRILEGRHADMIISSLPWTLMSASEQESILQAIIENLRPGGTFATYVCLNAAWFPAAQRLRQLLHTHFAQVTKSPMVWNNMPPAFVYFCRRS